MKKVFTFIGLMLASVHSLAVPVTLGNDANCTYNIANTSIQNLVDAFAGEIRVTKQVEIIENIQIDRSITIQGGYENCNDAALGIKNGVTTINGNNQAPVISISDGNDLITVIIDSLKLKNGVGLGSQHGGGLSVRETNNNGIKIVLRKSIVSNNNGNYGGGIFLYGPSVSLSLDESNVLYNEAVYNGGGIYCHQGFVRLSRNSGITLNSAYNASNSYGLGGGLYAGSGCEVEIRSGTSGSLFNFKGIAGNSSSNHGGGIYAQGGSVVKLQSYFPDEIINVTENYADANFNGSGEGGAAYLTGAGTKLEVYGGLIKENSAVHGGGISVNNAAELIIGKFNGVCWSQNNCNQIVDNEASTNGGFGGAIYSVGGNIDISYADISDNRADNGVVLYADFGADIKVRASMVHDNGNGNSDGWEDIYNFSIHNSDFIMNHVTSAYNDVIGSSLRIDSGSYTLENSIIYDPDPGVIASITGVTGTENCLVVNSSDGLNQFTQSLVAFPNFIDVANRDYHVRGHSEAADLCPETPNSLTKDFEGQNIWDDPSQVNIFGFRDAGADETYLSDTIFASGFD